MSLQDNVVNLLTSREAQRINFALGPVAVYGHGFGAIAEAIGNGHIVLYGMTSRVPGALLCEYRESEGVNHVNRLLVDVGLDFGAPMEAQLVIHEATHALMDYRGRALDLLASEAAAYIAGASYCVLKRLSYDDTLRAFDGLGPGMRDPEMMTVYNLAYGIADGILRTRGGYAVAPADVDMLKQTIGRTRLYRSRAHETVAYDGI